MVTKQNLIQLTLSLLIAPNVFAATGNDVLNYDSSKSIRSVGISKAVSSTDLQLTYDLRDLKLQAGETIYLEIPAQYSQMPLDFAALTHRQDPKYETECRGGGDRDCHPGYTSLEFFDGNQSNMRDGWRYWGGVGSGPLNSKFAEIRSGRGETDNLYEWRKKGHYSVEGKKSSHQELKPVIARIRSIGPDMVRIQRVIFKFLPPMANNIRDVVFSDGFVFGDYATSSGRRYPGRADQGDYGNPLKLRTYERPDHHKLPKDWSTSKGSIRIPLPAGETLGWLDLAVGDMKEVPRGADPEQYRGGASLTVKRVLGSHVIETLMDDENVGTNGVMRALPSKIGQVIASGEELEISVDGSSAKIMGIRLGTSPKQ